MFYCPKSDFIFKCKQMKIEQPPQTVCCSTCIARKQWMQKKNTFPCIFGYITQGICLISVKELTLIFSLPKSDSLWQMNFHSFSRGQKIIWMHFLWYTMLYILLPRLFELIVHWHLAVFLCDANSNSRSWQRPLFSKSPHLPLPIMGVDCRATACHMTISKMTFYRDHLQLWV